MPFSPIAQTSGDYSLVSEDFGTGPPKPKTSLTSLTGAAFLSLRHRGLTLNDKMTLYGRSLQLYLSGRAAAAAAAAAVPLALERLFSGTVLVAAMWLLLVAAPHRLPTATAVQVLSKCAAAQNATTECLVKEATRLREMASSEKHWFVNSSVGIAPTVDLLGHFCKEYNKTSDCLCHVKNQCSEDEDADALATVQVAHFGVFANLCRHDNITRDFLRKPQCYSHTERVVNDCFTFCWENPTCASCREAMDCAKELLAASCERDPEFVRVLELLLRVRENFVDAHGCYPDSSAPLELSFRTSDLRDKCTVRKKLSSQSQPARGGLTSGGGGGPTVLRAPAGTEFVTVAASILLSALSSAG